MGTVGEKGDQAKQAANEKSTQAGERLTGLADTLREKTQTLEPDHPVANVATKAAGALEQTGSVPPGEHAGRLDGRSEATHLAQAARIRLVAAGLGYMAARAFRNNRNLSHEGHKGHKGRERGKGELLSSFSLFSSLCSSFFVVRFSRQTGAVVGRRTVGPRAVTRSKV